MLVILPDGNEEDTVDEDVDDDVVVTLGVPIGVSVLLFMIRIHNSFRTISGIVDDVKMSTGVGIVCFNDEAIHKQSLIFVQAHEAIDRLPLWVEYMDNPTRWTVVSHRKHT